MKLNGKFKKNFSLNQISLKKNHEITTNSTVWKNKSNPNILTRKSINQSPILNSKVSPPSKIFNNECVNIFNKSQKSFQINIKKQEKLSSNLKKVFKKNTSTCYYKFNDTIISKIRDSETKKYLNNRDFVYGNNKGYSLKNGKIIFLFSQKNKKEDF